MSFSTKGRRIFTMMLIVLILAFWAWASSRETGTGPRPTPRSPVPGLNQRVPAPPQSGDVNLPASDALIPTAQFTQDDIASVFTIISDKTGWSIFPSVEVGRAKVSLWATNISPQDLLDRVVTLAGFVYNRSGNTISVMTYDEYMKIYGVRKEVLTLKYAQATSAMEVVKPFLTSLGKVMVHKDTNTLVLYETAGNIDTLIKIVLELDSPTEKILVEIVQLKYVECEALARVFEKLFANSSQPDRNKSERSPTGPSDPRLPKGPGGLEPSKANYPTEQVGVYPLTHANQLVVVGTQADIDKVRRIVSEVDIASDNMVLEVISLKYADAEILSRTLRDLFKGQAQSTAGRPARPKTSLGAGETADVPDSRSPQAGDLMSISPNSQVELQAMGRTNQIVVKAFRGDIEKIKRLIQDLDVFVEPLTQSYHFTYVDASQVYTGLEHLLDGYGGQGPSGRISGQVQMMGAGPASGVTLVARSNSILVTGPPSVHRIVSSIQESIDIPATYGDGLICVYKIENANIEEVAKTLEDMLREEDSKNVGTGSGLVSVARPSQPSGGTAEFVPPIIPKVSVNKAINSIVVKASERQQKEVEQLIAKLDVRRKQVLIEAMIVEVKLGNDLDLGMELDYVNSKGNDGGFTSFGLSTYDFSSRSRSDFGGIGATVAILNPEGVQAILHALQTKSSARIQAAPQILVNDNEAGEIHSIAEEPTQQTNLNNNIAVTSFGDYVEAGTQFQITPHISDSNYLHVEYNIELSSFGDRASNDLPPARSKSNISSKATVPDGHTIVVGGIRSNRDSKSTDQVPLLGDIPLIGRAFKKSVTRKETITTYLFITPTIMRNADFSDLRGASWKAMSHVDLEGDANEPARTMEEPPADRQE